MGSGRDDGLGRLADREGALLPRIITKLVGWAVAIFYQLERSGPTLPDGPVLVTANHPNSLVDPLVIFHTAGRPTRPLAKAPLFEQALVGTVLRGLEDVHLGSVQLKLHPAGPL